MVLPRGQVHLAGSIVGRHGAGRRRRGVRRMPDWISQLGSLLTWFSPPHG